MIPAFLLPLLLIAQDKPAEKCTFSGTVVNYVTGEPLDKVEISTEPAGNRGGSAASATTDVMGHFVLPNLEPGQYRLKGKRNRFLDTYYGARRAESNGIPITVEAGQTVKDLQFKLLPFGVIAGTIRDAEGEPLVRVTVTAMRLKFDNGRRKIVAAETSYTDDLGQYRLTGLAPGKYYVRAEPKPKSPGDFSGFEFTLNGSVIIDGPGELQFFAGAPPVSAPASQPSILLATLYPGVQDSGAARMAGVDAGGRVVGIDIALPRSSTVRVSGHVSAPAGTTPNMVELTYGHTANEAIGYRLFTSANPSGEFEFPAVPPGPYTLTAQASPPAKQVNGPVIFSGHQAQYRGQTTVQIGSTPVDGLRVVVSGGADIAGRITVVPAKDKPDAVQAESNGVPVEFDDGISDTTGSMAPDGQTFAGALSPGRYQVYVSASSDLVVRSITSEGKDVLADGLTIAGPGRVPLEIVLAADAGKVDGTVLDKDEKPAAGATVVLVPEPKLRARKDRYQQVETDQYGRFEMQGIAPGEYLIIAWEDVEPGIWHDPDFLKNYEGKGERVTIRGGGHESAKVHLIQ